MDNKKVTKAKLHPKNKHQGNYDFNELILSTPELKSFVQKNKYGNDSINFSDPEAIKALNKALLKTYYNIEDWDIPKGYLCPPIPGRVDYIHHIAELMGRLNYGKIPYTYKTKCMDIGVGASCIYPLLGSCEYGWSFIGTDIDSRSIESSKSILFANPDIKRNVDLRLQKNEGKVFGGILKKGEKINLTICNPPFHESMEDAIKGNLRKTRNLKGNQVKKPVLNFSGHSNELWCKGGERKFIRDMIFESAEYGSQVFLYSTLVSKKANLKSILQALHSVNAQLIETINMGQGNKTSRIVAWSFLNKEQRKKWKNQ